MLVKSDVSVLVHGETGTGKELVAKALHQFGARKDKPFLAENCAAVPANLLESSVASYFNDGQGDVTWADAGSVANNNVLSQVEIQYDADNNPIQRGCRAAQARPERTGHR